LVARSIQQEINEGRGFDDGCVRLDLRHLGAEKIKQKLPQIREIAKYFAGVDPIEKPIPVRPTVHYTMGGIDVDTDCHTSIRGLFAAGESACVSVHGANRLGGNSLLEAMVFGIRAGHSIPAWLTGGYETSTTDVSKLVAQQIETFAGMFGQSTVDVPTLRQEMERAMVAGFGLFRDQGLMDQGLETVKALRERFKNVRVKNAGRVFNSELTRALELGAMLDVAYVCAIASAPRKESRGSHYRADFPDMDNANFLKHSLVRLNEDGTVSVSYRDVTLVDVEPLDRITY
jgi:succinate dehydrogenase/fumarate reductase flavoprotein subunit